MPVLELFQWRKIIASGMGRNVFYTTKRTGLFSMKGKFGWVTLVRISVLSKTAEE